MPTIISKSGKTITLRYPRKGDTKIMFDYITQIGQEDTFILMNPQELTTLKEETEYLKGVLKRISRKQSIYYLCFYHHQLIGSAEITEQGKRKHHLGQLGISLSKDYRGDGIGQKLIQTLIAEAKKIGITKVILGCFANNHFAHHLYLKLGFKEYGRLPGGLSYQNKFIDHIFMYKDI